MGDYNIDYKTFALTGRIIGVYILPRASPHFVQLALGYVLYPFQGKSLQGYLNVEHLDSLPLSYELTPFRELTFQNILVVLTH